MRRILQNRGVQAAAAAAVTLTVLTVVFADRYPGAWAALWLAWAAVTAAAVTNAARRARLMPRPGPRRVLVGAKVHPDTAAAIDRQATITGSDATSDVARIGLELVASLDLVRRPGKCGNHDGAHEEQMYVATLPGGSEVWFCETTQQITQGSAEP